MRSYYLKASGEAPIIKAKGEEWTEKELQDLVGGSIEILDVIKYTGWVLVINTIQDRPSFYDRLRLYSKAEYQPGCGYRTAHGLPFNNNASGLWTSDPIFGDAVLTDEKLVATYEATPIAKAKGGE